MGFAKGGLLMKMGEPMNDESDDGAIFGYLRAGIHLRSSIHDLRQPLAAALNWLGGVDARLARASAPVDVDIAALRGALARAADEVKRANGMLDGLRALVAGDEALMPQTPESLGDVVSRATRGTEVSSSRVEVECPAGLMVGSTTLVLLRQMVIEASPRFEGDVVTLRLTAVERGVDAWLGALNQPPPDGLVRLAGLLGHQLVGPDDGAWRLAARTGGRPSL
jgi:hypothetical protein